LDIGGRLKSVREAKGLSQRELAFRAGLTNGAISLIEQNKSSPSVSSLKRLLDAIPMSMADFFSEVEEPATPKYFYLAEEFTELSPHDVGHGEQAARISLRQVGDAAHHNLQVLHETYSPGAGTGEEMLSHDGEEAGVVISGVIEVTVGREVRILNAGDGYLFDSRLPHKFRNVGDKDCVIISACTPPTF